MLVTTLPFSAFAQELRPEGEELEKLDYEIERVDGQDYLKVTIPPNSVEIVEDSYSIRPMSITDTVPDQGGAGHLINWGAGVLWYDYNNTFPPKGKEYVAELTKRVNGKNIVIAKTDKILTASGTIDDMEPDKPTTYQFTTTDAYEVGDEKKSGLVVNFPIELEQNILYEVETKSVSGKLGTNNNYWLIFLAVTRLTSPVYTAEWDTTIGALKPTLKGKLVTGTKAPAEFKIFDQNGKYGNIIDINTFPQGYIDENDKDGKLIGLKKFDANGSLSSDEVQWGQGQNPVMKGEFLSYTQFENGQNVDKPLNNKKGMIPSYVETKFDYGTSKMTESKYPAYFYNLVGDNNLMWRFQLKEGLEVKFNTGVGKLNESGEAGQDIGTASTIAYGEKFDTNLKGAFSENTITLPTVNLVAPTLNKNNVNLTFKGWKLVEGKEEPRNQQEIKTDSEGKQTLTEVKPDYATTDALKAALSDSNFKGFTGKNPVFYAIFGQTQGKAKIQYVDDKGTDLLKDEFKIQGQDYKTEKLGELNETVTASTADAPEFKGYAINKVEIEPVTDAKYVDPATATIKFVYKVKATTDDKSGDTDYIKVTFDANDGHFGETTTDTTKDVYVLKDKTTFADAKEKVSNPTKDNADFKEWQTAKTSGQTVADDKTLSTADETFYANYEEKLPGKATVEYIDVKTGKAIEEKYRAEDAAKYPAEKEGKQGEKISADVYTKDTAPKFVGYEFNRVEISPKDGAYALPGTSVIKVYYNKLDDIIPDDTPDTDDDKPEGYVTVKFLADDDTHTGENARGTLSGKTKYYVNPKAEKKNSDLTEPTIKAKTGFTVKENDEKWSPKFDKTSKDFITADATYIAQYKDGDDVIPVPDPSNPPEKPEGYVTVKFDLDGKGTTTDTKEFYVNPNKEVKITAPTVKGINNYEQKAGDDAWSPKFVTKAKYDKDTTFVAQYNFTKDVVPQGPGEDKPVVPDNYVKVTFKEGDHGVISASQTTIFWVNPDKEVDLTEKAPTVKAEAEYKHTGWDKPLKSTFTTATDITAKYLKKVLDKEPTEDADKYVKVDFKAETHGKIKENEKTEYWVLKDETVELKTPAVEANKNYAFKEWNPAVQTSYSKDKTHNAVFVYTGDDVVPQKPGEETPDVPDNFVEVVFAQGDHGTIAADATTTYRVNPEKQVTVTAPSVTANDDYKHVAWTYGTKEETNLQSVTDTFKEKKTIITAKYLKKVLDNEPTEDKDVYVKVTFMAEANGKLADDKTEKSYWVLKDTPVSLTEPTVTANPGWKFIKFEPAVQASYSEDKEHKAQYKKIIVTEDPKDKDYVKVTFDPGKQGTIKTGSNAEVWVLKDETIDKTKITPEIEVKDTKYAFKEWTPAVKDKYTEDTKHVASYTYNGDDVVPQKPGEDKPNVPDDFVKVEFTKGEHGIISSEETTIYWVNPKATDITVTAPKVTAAPDWKHTGWDPAVKTAYTKATTHVAQYKEKVVTTDPGDEDYVKLTFKAEANGKFAGNKTESYVWVLKDTEVKVTPPEVTPNKGYTFTEWSPAVKTIYTIDTTHTAQYKQKDKIIDDPTTPQPEDGYVRLTFDATKDGKINGKQTKVIDVLDTLKYSDKDLQDKIESIKAIPNNTTKKFNAWTPAVPADDTAVTEETYTANYVDKDKIIDVTPGSEDDNPDNGYVRFIFNGVGKDADDAEVQGTVKGNAKYAFDVLKGTKFSDNDLQTKINSLKAVAKDYKFIKWTPDVLNNDTLVEAGNVTKHEYTATYEKLEKIIDVTDPTVEPDEYHVRLTFKSGEGTFGKDAKNQDIKEIAIDVLKETSYTDKDLQNKVKEIEGKAKANDENKKFNAWNPQVPATGLVERQDFTAQYVDKDKIVDKDPDNPGEVQEGYIRFVFDANTKDDPVKTGKIGENQKVIFDVLKGTKFSDSDLQDKINKIVPVANDNNLKFNVWDPSVLKDNTLVENATEENGMSADKTTITYNATYKDKDADIVPGSEEKPDGYVTVRFLTNKNGTLTGETTYYVNPKAGKKMSDIIAPIITANDGYSVATPKWKPDFTNDTSEIKEDRNYVANYNSFGKAEVTYISMDTKMGKVDPASEEIKDAEDLKGSTATAESGYEFVNWVDVNGKQVSDQAKFTPNKKEAAVYIAVFKEKTTETTADKVQKLYDFEGVDLAAFVGDELTNEFWKGGVKTTEKAGSTLNDAEKAAINTALEKATVSDKSGRNTKQEVLYPSKGTLEVKFEDGSTITVEQKLYVYGNGSEKPEDPNQPTPKDEVDVTYKAGDGVESFTDKVVMVKNGTLEKDLPGKPDAKAKDGFKDPKWTANPAIDATNGIQGNTTLTASAVVDHDFEKMTFTVKKVWPAGITDIPTMNFTLYRKVIGTQDEPVAVQGAEVKEITKTTTEATWDNLAKTNSEGKNYVYSVKETFAEKDAKNDNWILGTMETDGEGNNTITNKLKTVPGEGDKPDDDKNFVGKLTITKKLENEPVSAQTMGMRRAPAPAANDPVKFKFKVTGPYGYESEEFELAAGESMTFENLAYGDYTVKETDAKGYTPEYSKAKETLTKDSPNGSITVINKNVKSTDPENPSIPSGQVIDITVNKVWDGGEKPATEIELWRTGYGLNGKVFQEKVDSFTTTANGGNEQTHKFENLAKHDPSGRDFTYYAVEPNVPANYKATYSTDKLTVTNNYEAPPTPAKEYKVTYVKGAEAATGIMAEVKVKENTDYTILGNGFEYADHNFTGWKVEGTEEIKQPGDVIEITKDVKLIAQWEEKTVTPEPTEFTIKYISADTNQGTVNPAQEVVAIDATAQNGTIAGSTATANAGYKFVK